MKQIVKQMYPMDKEKVLESAIKLSMLQTHIQGV